MKNGKFSIGFDLGGTKLAAALLRQDGKIIESVKIPVHMGREKSAKETQKRVVQLIADIALDFKQRYPKECSAKNFKGVGLASAGPLNVEKGELVNPANYPGWKVVPIRKLVEQKIRSGGFKVNVHFQNDAIAAALAEGWIGSAKKLKSYALITVGTGIGSGVIFNGKPCQYGGMGSEFGHTYVRFGDEASTVEKIASGTGLIQRARKLGFQGQSVEELVAETDKKFDFLYTDMAQALAALCYNLSLGFNLEGIFFSGGLLKIQDRYFEATTKNYQDLIRAFNPAFECPVKVAKTRTLAGVVGAGFLPFLERN